MFIFVVVRMSDVLLTFGHHQNHNMARLGCVVVDKTTTILAVLLVRSVNFNTIDLILLIDAINNK